ncbi:MAG: hypothetical protein VB024_10620 [Dysgonamonadaceae bacterium]|nr:hypothetical protein [Dysgonamonadaceae bacterium]
MDSYLVNGETDLAYILSREKDPTATEENLHRLALRWLRSPTVATYIKERRAVIYTRTEKVSDMEKEDVTDLVEKYKDKDFIIAELIKTQTGLKAKEKADILQRIADLQQMKKEENKSEENRVHYYLPLQVCKDCPNRGNLVKERSFRHERKSE